MMANTSSRTEINNNHHHADEEESGLVPFPSTVYSIFLSKDTYHHVAAEFHSYHKHDLNVFLHVWTTGLGSWGAVQLFTQSLDLTVAVYIYMTLILLTCPFTVGVLHTIAICGMIITPLPEMFGFDVKCMCVLAMALGYGLQDVAHWICAEKTFMGSYIKNQRGPWMLIVHTIWLMPLVIDSCMKRSFYLPNLVNRNRIISCKRVASYKAVNDIRAWINDNVSHTVKETTHIWPRDHEGTSGPVEALEADTDILAAFRKIFPTKHYDIMPVRDMNEIYVTAVGSKKKMNSDAVFYTRHNDGPYWFLPGASLYRVLVGVTPNDMVRTRFNFQHESQNKVVDMYEAVGFDYNRELHWIDHIPGKFNSERRSLVKLHFIVYPVGWKRYGNFCARMNTQYNTWARGNFLQTLRPHGFYDRANAWWIWITTTTNATLEQHVGWNNLVYIGVAYALGPLPFLILTSFRHYAVYISTFAYRKPMVAHGAFVRDVLLFKTIALMHLSIRLLPMVKFSHDAPGFFIGLAGFSVTMIATTRLGMVRTYFGAELGFVKPEWVSGFPYGFIPHPMILGQIISYSTFLFWWWDRLSLENMALLAGHVGFYFIHMLQEMLTSSY